MDLERFWNPLLYIDNILSETKEATWLTALPNARGEAFVLERRRVRGVFMENLELNDFPLDVQVSTELTTHLGCKEEDAKLQVSTTGLPVLSSLHIQAEKIVMQRCRSVPHGY